MRREWAAGKLRQGLHTRLRGSRTFQVLPWRTRLLSQAPQVGCRTCLPWIQKTPWWGSCTLCSHSSHGLRIRTDVSSYRLSGTGSPFHQSPLPGRSGRTVWELRLRMSSHLTSSLLTRWRRCHHHHCTALRNGTGIWRLSGARVVLSVEWASPAIGRSHLYRGCATALALRRLHDSQGSCR